MARRSEEDMEVVADQIEERIKQELRDDVLTISANDLAAEFGVSTNTVIRILRSLGAKNDGYYWYFEK